MSELDSVYISTTVLLVVIFLLILFNTAMEDLSANIVRKKKQMQLQHNMDEGFYNKLIATHNAKCLADYATSHLNNIEWKMNNSLDAILYARDQQRYAERKLKKYVAKTRKHPLGTLIYNIASSNNYINTNPIKIQLL